MKNLFNLFAFITTASLFFSCNDKASLTDYPILKASLNEKQVSIFDIFSEIDIISLTTSDHSLFDRVDKIAMYKDSIFILDRSRYSITMFGADGHYINTIHKVGRGPNEYLMAYDFVLDKQNEIIHILNPVGSIHSYRLDGQFIEQVELPKPPHSYQHFEMLNQDNFVTWSRVDYDDEMGMNILDISDNSEIKKSFFPYTGLWGGFREGSVFHTYLNTVYYQESMGDKVYSITDDGPQIAYQWDLGINFIDANKLKAAEGSTNDAQWKLVEEVKEGKIPFFFGLQFQSQKYYFALLKFYLEINKYLFYDKSTTESFFFEKTTEGIDLNILYMAEDYAIGIVKNDNEAKALMPIVSDSEAKLLSKRKEDDNWWLVKYTFKD